MRIATVLVCLMFVTPALAQDHAAVDPDHVKVVAENDTVRVLRYRYEPRQKSAQHSHPANTVDVALTKGRVRLISPDGRFVEHSVEAGSVNLNPSATHIVENLGDTPFEGLSIEPKTARPQPSSSQTVYEPSADDPRIKAVLDARERAADAARRADWKAVEASFAPDVVVNSPTNRVVTFADIIARFRSGQIAAEPGTVANRIEFVGVRGDSVVVMAEESFTPGPNAPNAGKLIRRRSTDIWKQYGGAWKLAIRQATLTSVE